MQRHNTTFTPSPYPSPKGEGARGNPAASGRGIEKRNKWEIDRNSLVDMPIDGFDAKYFKHIDGGYRIKFKIKKRKC